jgi:hypothetical protein
VNDISDPYSIRREAFDHPTAAKWIRYFAAKGLAHAALGRRSESACRLLGPAGVDGQAEAPAGPGPRSRHDTGGGRVPGGVEKIPVHYCSMHHEGEGKRRWPAEGTDRPVPEDYSHNDNMWWPDHRVADLLK